MLRLARSNRCFDPCCSSGCLRNRSKSVKGVCPKTARCVRAQRGTIDLQERFPHEKHADIFDDVSNRRPHDEHNAGTAYSLVLRSGLIVRDRRIARTKAPWRNVTERMVVQQRATTQEKRKMLLEALPMYNGTRDLRRLTPPVGTLQGGTCPIRSYIIEHSRRHPFEEPGPPSSPSSFFSPKRATQNSSQDTSNMSAMADA